MLIDSIYNEYVKINFAHSLKICYLLDESETPTTTAPNRKDAINGLRLFIDYLVKSSEDYSSDINRLLTLEQNIIAAEVKQQSEITSFFNIPN